LLLQDESLVVSLIQRHLKYTGSSLARGVLNDWDNAKKSFVKVFPHEYQRALKEKADLEVRNLCCPCPTALLRSWRFHGSLDDSMDRHMDDEAMCQNVRGLCLCGHDGCPYCVIGGQTHRQHTAC
jgi:hypothetical protein